MITIRTTLGTNPLVFQEGPFIFRVSVETNEKHPWEHCCFWDYSSTERDMLYLNDVDDNEILVITGLPIVPESDKGGNWYNVMILPGTRYSLELMLYPAFPVDKPIVG